MQAAFLLKTPRENPFPWPSQLLRGRQHCFLAAATAPQSVYMVFWLLLQNLLVRTSTDHSGPTQTARDISSTSRSLTQSYLHSLFCHVTQHSQVLKIRIWTYLGATVQSTTNISWNRFLNQVLVYFYLMPLSTRVSINQALFSPTFDIWPCVLLAFFI